MHFSFRNTFQLRGRGADPMAVQVGRLVTLLPRNQCFLGRIGPGWCGAEPDVAQPEQGEKTHKAEGAGRSAHTGSVGVVVNKKFSIFGIINIRISYGFHVKKLKVL